ncbi:DUF3592 domain-containing protein [Streptomyces sp. NPDC060022]|uniref:DUF3592 domain-containing protein n=1 Tax=Streptomyces sp. NPDC060022 TaxID=3347039 RepID=UPI00368C27DE
MTAACFMGWDAWQEDQALSHLRSRGQEVTATVVSVTGWSNANEALRVDVRFEGQSGPARTNVDLEGDSVGSKPGDRLTIVYDPVHPATVRLRRPCPRDTGPGPGRPKLISTHGVHHTVSGQW